MSMRKRILAAVGGVGLTLAVAATAVTAGGVLGGSAAASTPTATTAAASTSAVVTSTSASSFGFVMAGGGMGAFAAPFDLSAVDPGKGCTDLRTKLATNLGVTEDQLQAAIKKSLIQQIDEAEKAGTMTADQAKAARDRVNSATDLCAGLGAGMIGPGGGGQRPGGGQGPTQGARLGDSSTMKAAAAYFGITTDQLQLDLKEKGSLQGVAAKYGKDTAAGKAALQQALVTALKADLTQRGLSQEMIDRFVTEFTKNFDTLYTSSFGQMMPGGPGGPSGPGKRPSGPRTSPSPSASPSSN